MPATPRLTTRKSFTKCAFTRVRLTYEVSHGHRGITTPPRVDGSTDFNSDQGGQHIITHAPLTGATYYSPWWGLRLARSHIQRSIDSCLGLLGEAAPLYCDHPVDMASCLIHRI